MNDLISREDAIKLFLERKNELAGIQGNLGGAMSGVVKLIESLPSAQQWIPVSERLPETSGGVLVTRRFGLYVGDGYDRCIDIGYYYSNLNQWDTLDLDDIEVLAWMPLPEPYRG